MSEDTAIRDQVLAQCRAVAHMARAIAEVHDDKAETLALIMTRDDGFAEFMGRQTAGLMEVLGDLLNDMDAVTSEDDWIQPIFAEAHRRWPQPAA